MTPWRGVVFRWGVNGRLFFTTQRTNQICLGKTLKPIKHTDKNNTCIKKQTKQSNKRINTLKKIKVLGICICTANFSWIFCKQYFQDKQMFNREIYYTHNQTSPPAFHVCCKGCDCQQKILSIVLIMFKFRILLTS